jgi:hypothetical protein
MDDAPADVGAPAAEAGPDTTGDTGSEAYEQPDDGGTEEPPRQYVEIDDPDNRFVRVRVDGEDVEVPFAEALRGYSREADYTRKAQALAQQRQEAEFALNLQRALEANPEMTLRILAEQRGLTLAQQQGQQAPAEEEFEYTDPLERAIAEERRAREQLEARLTQRETDEALERTITGLRQQFNLNDDDVRQVVQVAYEGGYGIEALPMIYKTMAFDRLAARVQAQQAQRAQQEAETQRRTAAKSAAGQVVSSRTVGANGITNQVDAGGRMTLREAIEAAFEEAERG